MFKIEEVRDLAREAVAELDPACLDGRDAARLAEAAAEGAKLLDAATAMLAKRAAETNAWRRTSHAATADQWLAEVSGCTEGAARETFATAQRLESLPATAERLRSGELSLAQAAQVSAGAMADPGAGQRLLRTAQNSGIRELRAEKERVVAAATDEFEAHRRAKRDRHLRTWTEGFATRGSFSGPTEDVAKILAALEPPANARFEEARKVLSHGLLQLVITDGVDVQTVVSNTRYVPTALKIAIAVRDRTCKIRGCDRDRMLERHHTHDYAKSHRTTYTELGNLCPKHHDLVTNKRYNTTDNHDGTWALHAPAYTKPDTLANAPPGEAAA